MKREAYAGLEKTLACPTAALVCSYTIYKQKLQNLAKCWVKIAYHFCV